MKGLLELARVVNRKGDHFLKKNGSKNFHLEAQSLLEASGFHERFNFDDVVKASFVSNKRTAQNFKNLEFSDLPITLSRGDYCFIDVYFWRRRPTVIHNHHFTGAFMCLLGKNIDLEFTFAQERKIGKHHSLGKIALHQSRQLLPGDVAAIPVFDKFIHQNHHQADLTVNLCFRTPQHPKRSLANYLFSGLRFEKDQELIARALRLRKLLNIHDVDPEKVSFTDDDAIHFLLQNYGSSSENPRFLRVMDHFNRRLKKNLKLDVPKLLKLHDLEFEKIENEYE